MYKPLIIAVDGPAASGKGSVSKQVAEHFGYVYLDTGKLYRALGYQCLDRKIDVEDEEAVFAQAESLDLSLINSVDLGTEGIGDAASRVSAIPAVRKALLDIQRDVANNPKGAVLDGRDIGTVVSPNADVKFFITADIDKRAERRTKQLQSQGHDVSKASVLEDLRVRDERDKTRSVCPLKPASDALVIDTTEMSLKEVVEHVIGKVAEKAMFAA